MYDNPQHARECLEEFRGRYNMVRPHWALSHRWPRLDKAGIAVVLNF